jgi:putative transposase
VSMDSIKTELSNGASMQWMHSEKKSMKPAEEIYKTYKHNPPHLFRPHAKYFITAAIYRKHHLLRGDDVKHAVLEIMFESFNRHRWRIEEWVLLDNHYHLMADAPEDAMTLSRVINNFHRFSALKIKKNVNPASPSDPVWFNYFDTCITYEKSYFARLNYIWFNPVKHGYVEKPEEWKFGSYFFKENGNDEARSIMKNYPCDRIQVEDDF